MKHLGKPSSIGRFITGHKKLIIVGSIAFIFLVTLAGYFWWSVTVWNTMGTASVAAQTDTYQQITTTLALPAGTTEEKAKKHTALDTAHDSIVKHQAVCEVPALVSWQSGFDMVKKSQDECQATMTKLAAVDESLTVVTAYLGDEKALADLVVIASNGSTDLDESTWNDVAARWHALAVTTKELKVGKAFDVVLQRSLTETNHLDACWQELLAANAAKDRARFVAAKDELSKAYGTFKDVAQLSTTTFDTVQKEFHIDYVALAP